MNDLRKFSITDAVLEEICRIAKSNPDQTCMANEDLPIVDGTENLPMGPHYYRVSIDACKASKKPKKIWNAFTKLNIYNIIYVSTKPGYYSFVCKAYNGQVFTVDIQKVPCLTYKRAMTQALLGLAGQILEIKAMEVAEAQAKAEQRREAIRAKLGDAKIDIPDDVEITDELIDGIADVLEQIKDANLEPRPDADTSIADAEIVEETVLARGDTQSIQQVDESPFIDDKYKEAADLMSQAKVPPLVPYDPEIHS